MPEPKHPFDELALKFSIGTPIEEILVGASKIIDPIAEWLGKKRDGMSQENRDRSDLLEIVIRENFCLALKLVRPEQLIRTPITITGAEPK